MKSIHLRTEIEPIPAPSECSRIYLFDSLLTAPSPDTCLSITGHGTGRTGYKAGMRRWGNAEMDHHCTLVQEGRGSSSWVVELSAFAIVTHCHTYTFTSAVTLPLTSAALPQAPLLPCAPAPALRLAPAVAPLLPRIAALHLKMMIPGRELCDGSPGPLMASPKNKRGAFRTRSVLSFTLRTLCIVFILVVAAILLVVLLLVLLNGGIIHHDLKSSDAQTETAASSGKEINMISGAAGKYNANHAPVMTPPVQSQLHQEVVRVLQTAQYKEFAALLDNMTESVIRKGITVFAPCDRALSNFQMNKTEGLRVEDVVRFHVITSIMPFSNLLRLEVGSRLATEISNVTIPVTNASAGAYEVDDAKIVDPDLYTDATIAVHGINAVFNTSKIIEEEGVGEPVTLPLPSRAFMLKSPIKVKGVALFNILTYTFAGLFLI